MARKRRQQLGTDDVNMATIEAMCLSGGNDKTLPDHDFEKALVPGKVKTAMSASNASSRDLWQVPPASIRIMPGFNIRLQNAEYHVHIRELAESMKQDGFFMDKPLGAYIANEGGEEIIYLHDGHCRLAAVNIAISEGADIQKVPVVVSPPGTSLEDLTVSLVRSNTGKPLAPYEIALVCKRLSRYGWEASAISKRLGLSLGYVDKLLMLAAAPHQMRDMVVEGVVSADTAIQTLMQHGSESIKVLEAARAAAQTVGSTKITKKHLPGEYQRTQLKRVAEPMYQALEAVRSDCGFDALSDSIKAVIEKLLSEIAERSKQAIQASSPEGASKTALCEEAQCSAG